VRPLQVTGNAWKDQVYAQIMAPTRSGGPAGHRHDDVELNLPIGGDLEYRLAGQSWHLPAGRLAVFAATTPHRLTGGSAREVAVACIPLGLLLSWNLPSAWRTSLLAGTGLVMRQADPDDPGRFARWAKDLMPDGRPGPRRTAAVLELQGRLWRCVDEVLGADRRRAVALRGVDRAACYLAEHATGPVRLADVAVAANLHPNHLVRVFRAAFGRSVGSYLRGLRLTHAATLLAAGDDNVLAIALASGFGSQARFYDAFTRAHGMPPARWRRRQRGSGS
jgi:AraC-like DNA-binding protein